MKSLKQDFANHLQQRFPAITAAEPLIADGLLSPFTIELPPSVLTQAQNFIAAAFRLRENSRYQAQFQSQLESLGISDPGNKSILMSYDFHISSEGILKLIEINTNAAFLALGDCMYTMRGIPQPVAGFSIDEIRENILEEMDLWGQPNTRPEVAIVDENPSAQRLYLEFLVFNELMKEWGFLSEIKDINQLSGLEDFIYNRYTDFYFTDPKSAHLKKLFAEKKVCFSPNPFEYLLLADKQRMIDWTGEQYLENCQVPPKDCDTLRRHTPFCSELTLLRAEELWSQRKKLFFKPLRSFGSKQSFKGASISRKAFDEIIGQGFIAQEYVAAPEKRFETPEGSQDFKFDLRCYAYKGRLQSVVARIYQGQVTNLRTLWGGFAPVIFTSKANFPEEK